MAFDGAFIHTLLSELNNAEFSHVEKIYQPSKDELVFHLRKKDFSGKLHISARNGAGRIGFTDAKFENPYEPPMFCMLARKIFSSARFVSAKQKGLDRVIELEFQAVNEMGDTVSPKIICEFIGGSNNIIFTDENGKIADALFRSDITAARMIMPGCKYVYPEDRGKLNILSTDTETIISAVRKKGGEVSAALLSALDGLSPLVCRELAFSAFKTVEGDCNSLDLELLREPLDSLKRAIEKEPCYTVLYENKAPKDFCFICIKQYGNMYAEKRFSSGSQMLCEFYGERDKAVRMKRQSGDIFKTVNNYLSRVKRRMNLRIRDLEATKDREKLRICGELIKANIHLIKPGDVSCEVQNFYDENLAAVKIKLDPALSPAANAAKYFKEYKKSCAANASLGALIDSDKQEIEYLDSVLESIERATDSSDIAGIREELVSSGYIREKRTAKKPSALPQTEQHTSVEGYKILVGHNNIQNDYITAKLADKNDTWFHTKNIHGSHVVVKNGGREISEQTLLFAAGLAAKNSRAKNSSNVPVDYTEVKHVKKPAGAKAGMVIYTSNKTVFVTPWEE